MADFLVNQDVTTDQPVVEVTVSAAKPLPLGRQRFRLVVVDDSGNRSAADEVEVIADDALKEGQMAFFVAIDDIATLLDADRIPNVQCFVDSPLANRATGRLFHHAAARQKHVSDS